MKTGTMHSGKAVHYAIFRKRIENFDAYVPACGFGRQSLTYLNVDNSPSDAPQQVVTCKRCLAWKQTLEANKAKAAARQAAK